MRVVDEDPLEPRLGFQMDCSLGKVRVAEVVGVVFGSVLAHLQYIRIRGRTNTTRILVREVRIRALCSIQ